VNPRTVISLANLAAVVVAFTVLVELPQYSDLALYGLLGWMLVGFLLFYGYRSSRSAPSPGGAFPSRASAGPEGARPLPSETGSGPSAPLDFCIFCGNSLPVGAATCGACGHHVRAM
jgi:hypothetical protein